MEDRLILNREQDTEYSDKQLAIILVSEALFAIKGYDATSVRDIANEAEVNVAMISYYFGSKEKLLEAIFNYRFASSRLVMEGLLANKKLDPFQKLEALIEKHVDRQFENRDFFRIYMREQLNEEGSILYSKILQFKMRNSALFTALIEEGQRKKFFIRNVDVYLIMNIVFGSLNQTIGTQHQYRSLSGRTETPEEDFQRHLKTELKKHLYAAIKAIVSLEHSTK